MPGEASAAVALVEAPAASALVAACSAEAKSVYELGVSEEPVVAVRR